MEIDLWCFLNEESEYMHFNSSKTLIPAEVIAGRRSTHIGILRNLLQIDSICYVGVIACYNLDVGRRWFKLRLRIAIFAHRRQVENFGWVSVNEWSCHLLSMLSYCEKFLQREVQNWKINGICMRMLGMISECLIKEVTWMSFCERAIVPFLDP